MRKCVAVGLCAACLLCAGLARPARAELYDLGGTNQHSKNSVVTFDGTNAAVVNTYVGADTFYNSGIFGQETISANIEAGAIWGGPSGHQALTLSTYAYAGTGALGEVDRHATWVGSVLGGLNYNELINQGTNSYVDFGIAPLTFLASGSIATTWLPPEPNPDNTIPSYSGSFDTTQAAIYSTYNRFTNTNTAVNPTINAQYPFLQFPGAFASFNGVADVINSSWGFGDPGGSDDFTKVIDGLARTYSHTTVVVAAGNFPSSPTPANSVTGPASGYNVIAVGATQTKNTVSDFDQVADFSCRGPQDYFDPVNGTVHNVRAPVDIVAPGTTIVAAYYGGASGGNGPTLPNPDPANPANDLYSFPLAGTSFAAPIVSGAVSLLDSTSKAIENGYTFNGIPVPNFPSQSRDSRIIKAVLMNSAHKLAGWDNGQHFDAQAGHVVTTQSLDWAQGAGQVDFSRAFLQYIDPTGTHDITGDAGGGVSVNGWDLGALTLASHNDYPITALLHAGDLMDVTLTWFRDRGVNDATQTGTDDGQANLDLQIWDSSFGNLLASSESLYNTSEQLHFTLPSDGTYGFRVVYADQTFGSPMLETYGVAWNVAAVPEPGMMAAGVIVIALLRRGPPLNCNDGNNRPPSPSGRGQG
jgi:hypothetical protein